MINTRKPKAIVTKENSTTNPSRYYLKICFEYETVFYNRVTIEHLAEILEEEKIEYDRLKGDLSWADIYEAVN